MDKLRVNDDVTIVVHTSIGPVLQSRVVHIHPNGFDAYVDAHSVTSTYVLDWKDEGVRWARGWDTPEADALRAAVALADP